jgi:Dolichyl-phosphate-mannose-protein mannosyltransferase
MSPPPLIRRFPSAGRVVLVVILSALMAGEIAGLARKQSQTWDEAYHILAGYRYWQAADFGINSEHPPLVKLLATVPLLLMRFVPPHAPAGSAKQEGFVDAREFLYSNNPARILVSCRLAASLLTLLLALLVFEAGSRMFEPAAGILALALVVFEPNILAHGSLVDTDAAAACGFLAAVYAFYRYVQRPSALRLVECGLVAGVCLAVKHSGVLLFPILSLLALSEVLPGRSASSEEQPNVPPTYSALFSRLLKLMGALSVVGLLAWAVLWGVYGFRFSARPVPLQMTPPLADYIRGVGHPPLRNHMEAATILALDHGKLFPESYLYGLADVLTVSEGPRPTFIFGRLYPTARWYYFPCTILIKSTLGFLILLALSVFSKSIRSIKYRREVLFLVIPVVTYLAVSMTSGLNVGVRHILPVYPFLILLAAAGGVALARRNRIWLSVIGVLVFLHAASSIRAFPNDMAYSNEAWGGTAKTYRVLSDSNVDYGQGLMAAKDYLVKHQIRDCWFAYFGSADPDYYRIPCKALPEPLAGWWKKPVQVVPQVYEGTVLISATELDGTYYGPAELNPYSQFQKLRPDATLGGSILVFRGTFKMTLASAMSRANHALELQRGGHLQEATEEARSALALEPGLPFSHYAMGYYLALAKQTGAARSEYQTALRLAQTVQPKYLWYWVPFLEAQIKSLKRP